MAVREDTTQDVRHEPERHGRHGRPRPFGGRLRLPTLRFSGAAMAMSTVVGISIATTLLLNEQQGIGRRAGVARVGSTPPPTPGATDQAEAVSASTPAATPAPDGPSAARQSGHPSAHPSTHPSGAAPVLATPTERSAHPGELPGGRAAAGQDAQPPSGTQLAGSEPVGEPGTPAPTGPSPVAPPPPTEQPVGRPTDDRPPNRPGLKPTAHPVPPPGATDPGGDTGTPAGAPTGAPGPTAPDPTAPAPTAPVPVVPGPVDPDPSADHALSGVALVSPLGRDGLRHELALTVTESVTALQAEFRLAPGDSAAGPGTAWTDLPGAVVTVQQERGTLVYRFTTPPGTDVRPGHYTFGVRGARPAVADPSAARKSAPAESWSASAFALDHPRAVATLGAFGPTPALPAAPRPPGTPVGPAAPEPR
ncbi:hypothetical protein [Kitasatospora sp. NPDC097691]|uniref:hypothetical protein n=1 Tax=Kitasatospora sp. NPDC097691 TaxID=3157231 RepID=UPI003324A237